MYEIIFNDSAKRQLEKLESEQQIRIIDSLERIRVRPELFVRKLVGENAYKLRVGNYRIILDILKDTLIILVIKIGHRKNIYG